MSSLRGLVCLLAALLICGCGSLRQGRASAEKPTILWVDWEGLQSELATPESTAGFCRQARAAGYTHLALEATTADGRPAIGGAAENPAEPILRREAAAAGLRLAAALTLFLAPPEAPTERLMHRAEWTGSAWRLSAEPPPGGLWRWSPADPSAAAAELDRLSALAASEQYDFLILAGLGFDDPLADVGPAGRRSFEQFNGAPAADWPAEVIGWEPAPVPYQRTGRGPLYDRWLLWRGTLLRDFLAEARRRTTVSKGSSPRLVVVVDAPWQAHLRAGLNWAGVAGTSGDAAWLPEGYRATAAGELPHAVALAFWEADLVGPGEAAEAGYAWWASVEGSGATARRALPESTELWSFIPARRGSRWQALLAAGQYVEGTIVGPASEAGPE